jgi:hypothetical protein
MAAPAAARSSFGHLTDRYRDAYSVAGGTVKLGNIVKRAGFVLGGIMLLISLSAGGFWFFVGALAAVWIAASGYVAGVFMCAQGQLMSALLDVAVNTSPHLQDSEKASVMML